MLPSVSTLRSEHGRIWWVLALLLLVATGFLIWPLLTAPTVEREERAEPETVSERPDLDRTSTTQTDPEPEREPTRPLRPIFQPISLPLSPAGSPPTPPETEPEKEPSAKNVCHEGDVWELDGDGVPKRLTEECGDQLCRDDECETPDPKGCGDVGPAGRCNSDTVETCYAGRVKRQDCRAVGRYCVTSADHGAYCRALEDPPCDAPPRCDGEDLEVCEAGARRRIACANFGGRCEERDGRPMCVRTEPAVGNADGSGPSDCGPCGCDNAPAGPSGLDVCDGTDNDGDGVVDNDATCETVDIVAFVVRNAAGQSSYSEQDAASEVLRINQYFLDVGLSFRLRETRWIDDERWLQPDDGVIQDMHSSASLHEPSGDFFVPLVFVDVIMTGFSPKLGVATLPSGGCGTAGFVTPSDRGRGVVVVSKGRHETTGAHEIGHFLGLCHTHFGSTDGAVTEREGEACSVCEIEGDGVCDTPSDPGPPQCAYEPQLCSVVCAEGETPDVTNIMSYYHACRGEFSQEQSWLMRRTLATRRALAACAHGTCQCTPEGDTCTVGMSCQPNRSGATWACQTAGNAAEGAACAGHVECAAPYICASGPIQATCARPCVVGESECRCAPLTGTLYGVCETGSAGN